MPNKTIAFVENRKQDYFECIKGLTFMFLSVSHENHYARIQVYIAHRLQAFGFDMYFLMQVWFRIFFQRRYCKFRR